MTNYRYVCPHCLNDHKEREPCNQDDLKEQIKSLRIQLEFAHLCVENKRLQPVEFICTKCEKESEK